MGSQGIKRRKRRARPRPGGAGEEARGNWELQHSPYTFEGQIEGLGRFGRGLASASPRQRVVAKVVAAIFLLPLIAGFVAWAIR